MQFVRRVRTIWSWLPAFRAVAETEHLPTAAAELDVVPSSLSRMVKLLEDELGVSLFDRSAKSLVLNEAGRRLLAATRDAMRLVDDALAVTSGEELRGTAAAVASRDLAHVVLPHACAAIAERNPEITTAIVIDDDVNAPALLLRGDVDVALVLVPPSSSELVITEVAQWSRGVYTRAGGTDERDTMRCVVVGAPGSTDADGWPAHEPRHIASWAADERTALELVARSGLVTTACDSIARHSDVFERLARFPTLQLEPRRLYLVQRRALGRHRRTEVLVEAICASLAHLADS